MKIYALDDDQDFLKLLELKLHKMHLDCQVFSKPEDLLKQLKISLPDLCLVDLNLDIADGAGYQVIKAIRNKIDKKIIIFVISRRTNQEDISFALDIGADDYLAKPLDFLLFQHKVDNYFHLEKNNLQNLPSYEVPKSLNSCSINTQLQPYLINEFEWVFISPHFMARHASVELTGKLVSDIFESDKLILTVNQCQFLAEKKMFTIHFELKELNVEEIVKLRSWLLSQKRDDSLA